MNKILILFLLLGFKCEAQVTYDDSVKLFLNTQELKIKLIKAGYKRIYDNQTYELLEECHIIDAANHNNIPPKGMKDHGRYSVGAAKIGNLYRVYDFYFGQINKSLGYQYFSPKIKPYKKEV